MNNRLADLKRIEQLAEAEISKMSYWYEGKEQDIEMLQSIARNARIERLKLELYNKQ